MRTKPTILLAALLGLAVLIPTLAIGGPSKTGQKEPYFSNGDLTVTHFKPLGYHVADSTHQFSSLVLKGTPRFSAVIASQRATLDGQTANFQIDESAGLVHQGHVTGDVVISVSQADKKDGGTHVTKVTSPDAFYINQGTKAAPAFNLQLKTPVKLTSAYDPKKELATITGGAAHFEFVTPDGTKEPQLQSGAIAGPVKMRFVGLMDKADPAKKTVVTGSADRMEISREGTDYVIKLVGNVVFDNEGGLHFAGDPNDSASFRFTQDFGFKSYDGDGVTSITQEALDAATKASKKGSGH